MAQKGDSAGFGFPLSLGDGKGQFQLPFLGQQANQTPGKEQKDGHNEPQGRQRHGVSKEIQIPVNAKVLVNVK